MKSFTLNPNLSKIGVDKNQAAATDREKLASISSKAFLFVCLHAIVAVFMWQVLKNNIVDGLILHNLGFVFLASFPVCIATYYFVHRKPEYARSMTFIFAISSGVLVGSFSGIFEERSGGVVIETIITAFSLFISFLALYAGRYINVDNKFLKFMAWFINFFISVIAINAALSFLGLKEAIISDYVRFFFILGGLLVLVVMVLLIDFSLVEDYLKKPVSKEEEWLLTYSLVFDVVWIYFCLLFILTAFRSK